MIDGPEQAFIHYPSHIDTTTAIVHEPMLAMNIFHVVPTYQHDVSEAKQRPRTTLKLAGPSGCIGSERVWFKLPRCA
jgi:hypothetical protein